MKRLLNATQAAEHLGVCRTTFWTMRKNCPLKSVKVGTGSERFDVDELDRWVMNYDPNRSYVDA